MQCDRARELIGAYIDEELGGDDRASVASHIESCAVCTRLAGDIRRMSTVIAGLGRKNAPVVLASKIRSRLDAEGREQVDRPRMPWRMPSNVWRQAAALAACCMLSVLVAWGVVTSSNRADGLQQEIVTAHIRSLLQDSPIQVASSDAHSVKPWFAGRVDFAPEVKDLTAEGFPLVGGRLDYVDHHRVGVLVYRRRLHIVNVFMWRARAAEDAAPMLAKRSGHNLLSWTKDGVIYWAVSDLDGGELKRLQSLL
jgi:anti-sigma factor RsiW